jgi:hypothetical protein
MIDVGIEYLTLNRRANTFLVAKLSVFVWHHSSVRALSALCMFSMNRRLVCISAIMID